MSLLCIMSIILNCLAFSSHEVFFNSIRWLNVLTSVIAFFFFLLKLNTMELFLKSIQSHKQSHWVGACHPIIDSVIYEFPPLWHTEMLSPEPLLSNLNRRDKSATMFCIQ